MKAIVVREFGGPEVMKLEENAPDPTPGPGDVLVRIRAAGVNPVDTYIRTGTYARKPSLPYTPGFDGAGEVERVGADVKGFAPGDRVYIGGPGYLPGGCRHLRGARALSARSRASTAGPHILRAGRRARRAVRDRVPRALPARRRTAGRNGPRPRRDRRRRHRRRRARARARPPRHRQRRHRRRPRQRARARRRRRRQPPHAETTPTRS